MPPRVDPRGGLPRAAIAYLKTKRLRPSAHWAGVWRGEHAAAFTVARMTRLDLVRQTHRGLVRALERGETLETFRAGLQPWLARRGWAPTGRGGTVATRLRRLYDVNLRTARAAGQWDRITRTKALLPYLVYELGPSETHRPEHAAWAGLCLPVDDPWWRTHYPPNGWGCRCRVRQVARPPQGAVTTAPPTQTREWAHPVTGEITRVPVGIDPGWDTHVGRARLAGLSRASVDRVDRVLMALPEARADRWGRRYVARLLTQPDVAARLARAAPGGDRLPVGIVAAPAAARLDLTSRVLAVDAAALRRADLPPPAWAVAQRMLDAATPVRDGPTWRWTATLTGVRWRLTAQVAAGRATVRTLARG